MGRSKQLQCCNIWFICVRLFINICLIVFVSFMYTWWCCLPCIDTQKIITQSRFIQSQYRYHRILRRFCLFLMRYSSPLNSKVKGISEFRPRASTYKLKAPSLEESSPSMSSSMLSTSSSLAVKPSGDPSFPPSNEVLIASKLKDNRNLTISAPSIYEPTTNSQPPHYSARTRASHERGA